MQEECRWTEAEDVIEPVLRNPPLPEMTVDVARYQALLDDESIPAETREAFMQALWTIVVSLVELGFSVTAQASSPPESLETHSKRFVRDIAAD